MSLTPAMRREIEGYFAHYPDRRSAILPALHVCQRDQGHISESTMRDLAALLGLTPVQVYDVVTFYKMLRLRPSGRYLIQVCHSLSCALRGAEALVHHLERRLGITVGQMTPDGFFTLTTVECLASCGTAPACQVNDDYHENLTTARLDDLLERFRQSAARGNAKGNGNPSSPPSSPHPTPLHGMEREKGGGPDRVVEGARPHEVVFRNIHTPGYDGQIEAYLRAGGYQALPKALTLQPQEVIEMVKKSGLRGRGGAGFPAGMKWDFVPKAPGVKYLCLNADESEPGAFKDRELMEKDPHQMLEGAIIAAYAIGAQVIYIYIRGELVHGGRILERAVREAYAKGYLGKNILGGGYTIDCYIHRGAGMYICGEETALLESIEGKRGQPRYRPPFPAIEGLYGKPTVINNVETLANVPHIVNRGPDWFAAIGPPKSAGTKVFSVSGHVNRPGNYELVMGATLRQLIDEHAGGVIGGRRAKAVIPGGASAPILTEAHLDTPMDFDSMAKIGTMLGTGSVIVMDETTCMVWAAMNLLVFFEDESCGKCTPCREGTPWLLGTLQRLEAGQGRREDIDLLLDLCDRIKGKTLCPFGDAEVAPIVSTIQHFRAEYEAHVTEHRCPLRPEAVPAMHG